MDAGTLVQLELDAQGNLLHGHEYAPPELADDLRAGCVYVIKDRFGMGLAVEFLGPVQPCTGSLVVFLGHAGNDGDSPRCDVKGLEFEWRGRISPLQLELWPTVFGPVTGGHIINWFNERLGRNVHEWPNLEAMGFLLQVRINLTMFRARKGDMQGELTDRERAEADFLEEALGNRYHNAVGDHVRMLPLISSRVHVPPAFDIVRICNAYMAP